MGESAIWILIFSAAIQKITFRENPDSENE